MAKVNQTNLIFNQRFKISDFVGIYFLFDGDEIVYVGRSVNIIARIGSHTNVACFYFDSFSILKCDETELDEMEKFYIQKFEPKHNVTLKMRKGVEK